MNDWEDEVIRARVYAYWRANEYERAVTFLRDTLHTYRGEDLWVFECCYTLLNSSLSTLSRYDEAEAALREGVKRLPHSPFLHRALAQFLWDMRRQPDRALAAIDRHLTDSVDRRDVETTEDELSARIQALSLRGRLLVALGRKAESLGTLKSILSLLPPFSPVLGHLFDYDLVADLLRAGVRDPALRDLINRVTEPRFLVNGIPSDQFHRTKQYLNSDAFLSAASENQSY